MRVTAVLAGCPPDCADHDKHGLAPIFICTGCGETINLGAGEHGYRVEGRDVYCYGCASALALRNAVAAGLTKEAQ